MRENLIGYLSITIHVEGVKLFEIITHIAVIKQGTFSEYGIFPR
jgi:hypothetical protein